MLVRDVWRRHGVHVSTVAASLAGAGALSYVYLIVAARQLGPDAFGLLSVVWSLTVAIGAGVFIPVEQETSRAASAGLRHALHRGLTASGRVLAIVVVGAVALAPWAVPTLLNGDWRLWAILLCVAAASALVSPARGVLAARRAFRWYGLVIVLEAALRAIGALGLAYAAADERDLLVLYALVLPFSTAVAAAVAWVGVTRTRSSSGPRPEPPDNDEGGSPGGAGQLAWLVMATLLAQALINLPPVVVKATTDSQLAGQVLAILAIARIPVFLAPAMTAPLLPVMVRLHETHQAARLVRLVGSLVGLLLGCAAAAALLSLWVGGWIVELLFGSSYVLPPLNLAIVSSATFIFIAALLVTAALVAVRRNGWSLASWSLGLVVFGTTTWRVLSVPINVELGLLLGSAAAVVVSGGALVSTARRTAPA